MLIAVCTLLHLAVGAFIVLLHLVCILHGVSFPRLQINKNKYDLDRQMPHLSFRAGIHERIAKQTQASKPSFTSWVSSRCVICTGPSTLTIVGLRG
ncbi:hypothetical protein Y032_0431g1334 [Ancylostoma ceylanicum]|uniref:Uncharacterized protein n=1 Tax=Ancylostoma ceylanicum TaxID=53326 RepID=A0A016WZV9_9BILA|nr:hypothetical protein Y032_0431g1334 [Ancylostoma ceylanicum]